MSILADKESKVMTRSLMAEITPANSREDGAILLKKPLNFWEYGGAGT